MKEKEPLIKNITHPRIALTNSQKKDIYISLLFHSLDRLNS